MRNDYSVRDLLGVLIRDNSIDIHMEHEGEVGQSCLEAKKNNFNDGE